jgi:hypothetical protein
MSFEEIEKIPSAEVGPKAMSRIENGALTTDEVMTKKVEFDDEAIEELICMIHDMQNWSREVPEEDINDNSKKMARKAWFQDIISVFDLALHLYDRGKIDVTKEIIRDMKRFQNEDRGEIAAKRRRGRPIKDVEEKIEKAYALLNNLSLELISSQKR